VQGQTFCPSLRPLRKREQIQPLCVESEDPPLASRWRTTKIDVAIVLPVQTNDVAAGPERSIVATSDPTFGGLFQLNNSTLESDGDSVSPIICTQLGDYVRDVALHGSLANAQPIGNHFVRIPSRD
jgi:hypothetical protein